MVPELSTVRWFKPDELPPQSMDGKPIMIFSTITKSTQIVPWDASHGFGYDVKRWACIPQWRPNIKIVINQSFGRFAISDLCREEMGIVTDKADPRYISNAEIRQHWRYNLKLVMAVEKLGSLASALGSNLVVVEVPGNYGISDIIICERNGYENIEINSEGVLSE